MLDAEDLEEERAKISGVNPLEILGLHPELVKRLSLDQLVTVCQSQYKALAGIMHPDAGGSAEQFAELSTAFDEFKLAPSVWRDKYLAKHNEDVELSTLVTQMRHERRTYLNRLAYAIHPEWEVNAFDSSSRYIGQDLTIVSVQEGATDAELLIWTASPDRELTLRRGVPPEPEMPENAYQLDDEEYRAVRESLPAQMPADFEFVDGVWWGYDRSLRSEKRLHPRVVDGFAARSVVLPALKLVGAFTPPGFQLATDFSQLSAKKDSDVPVFVHVSGAYLETVLAATTQYIHDSSYLVVAERKSNGIRYSLSTSLVQAVDVLAQ